MGSREGSQAPAEPDTGPPSGIHFIMAYGGSGGWGLDQVPVQVVSEGGRG